MSESCCICLDVGGTKVLGAIFNQRREIVYRLKKRFKDKSDPEYGGSDRQRRG